ncbi:mycofactocin-coupled SDR family oxidoreductase [Cryptosporangium aurantiacum]|uniref:SDR family mycofactocin-dependent oxidoreductase n=1 Tax=Cryptosporangium aurantiacum TaxID=134849 RepID=A0A1M7RKC4_9ACTN|nr:mycofactocin-coupled SDR family oxidoreductase [Cryptosporangium aurantiacum]SHN46590.1 SDR family mycofactocin-dependent oxidoreductase [Cryptosporangium aurantiacum]
MGRVEGKVAFVTGAARGQGRSHAVRLAEEGADIIAIDLCKNIDTVDYPLSTPEDLKETARQVEALDRRIVAREVDTRDPVALRAALEAGVAELGHLDVVVANAGIAPMSGRPKLQAWSDVIDVNLIGAINTIQAALPHLGKGASIIATGSIAAMISNETAGNPGGDPGGTGYMWAKRTLASYIHELGRTVIPARIRVNAVHPTNTNTNMLHSRPMYRAFRPDKENPTREEAEEVFPTMQGFNVPYVEPGDISAMVVFLASDESRYVTGMQMRVDAGAYLKLYDWHV